MIFNIFLRLLLSLMIRLAAPPAMKSLEGAWSQLKSPIHPYIRHFAIFFPGPKYKKMLGFATSQGQDFEMNLAALLYLRGLNSGLQFELGTNVAGAGALDDIVFRFKPTGEADTWRE